MSSCDTRNPSSEEKTEADNVTSMELQRNRRVLYFSDGTMEEASDSEHEVDAIGNGLAVTINESELPFVPLLKYKAHRMGSSIMSGIDYIGGGLASFLGITTPKYASEMEHYQRSHNDLQGKSEYNSTWRDKDNAKNNLNEVIIKEPSSEQHIVGNQ